MGGNLKIPYSSVIYIDPNILLAFIQILGNSFARNVKLILVKTLPQKIGDRPFMLSPALTLKSPNSLPLEKLSAAMTAQKFLPISKPHSVNLHEEIFNFQGVFCSIYYRSILLGKRWG